MLFFHHPDDSEHSFYMFFFHIHAWWVFCHFSQPNPNKKINSNTFHACDCFTAIVERIHCRDFFTYLMYNLLFALHEKTLHFLVPSYDPPHSRIKRLFLYLKTLLVRLKSYLRSLHMFYKIFLILIPWWTARYFVIFVQLKNRKMWICSIY